MLIYCTFREGPSPAESEPILIVSDARLVSALIAELGKLAEEDGEAQHVTRGSTKRATAHRPAGRREPRPHQRTLRALPVPATEVPRGH